MNDKNIYPLISIGIPTYNGSKRLHRSLNSVLAQGYPNLEIIVSDNCSTDNTGEVVAQYAKKHPGIHYHKQEQNKGIHHNFFYVLQQATGKYFMWVSDDDTIEQGTLFKCVEFLEAHPDFMIATGQIRYWWKQPSAEDKFTHYEGDFNLHSNNAANRVVQYYYKVRWGAMFHGLMRRELAQGAADMPKVYGYDYHFVASLAFLGKFAVLDFNSYNKYLGGLSESWLKFARSLGESDWVGRFPFVKMAIDAYKIINQSPIFDKLSRPAKILLGIRSFGVVLFSGYPGRYYRLGSKKLKKLFSNTENQLKEQIAK